MDQRHRLVAGRRCRRRRAASRRGTSPSRDQGRPRPAPGRAPASAAPSRAVRPVAQPGLRARRPSRAPRRPGTPRARGRRGCRRGSPTAAARPRPACRRPGRPSISPRKVALDAGMIRPWSTSSPLDQVGQRLRGHAGLTGPVAGSRWPARTGGPSGSTGLPQNGQVGPAGLEHLLGPLHEGPRRCRRRCRTRKTSSGSGSSKLLVELLGADHGGLGVGEDLDHDPLVVGVPRQRHGAGAELLLDRLLQRVGVLEAERRDRRDQRRRRASLAITSSSSSSIRSASACDLLLLQRDADDARARCAPAGRRCAVRARRRCRRRSAPAGRSRGRAACQHTLGGAPKGPAPPPTAASSAVAAAACAFLRRRGRQPGQVAGVGVGRQHVGPGRRCSGRSRPTPGRRAAAGTGRGACRARRRGPT